MRRHLFCYCSTEFRSVPACGHLNTRTADSCSTASKRAQFIQPCALSTRDRSWRCAGSTFQRQHICDSPRTSTSAGLGHLMPANPGSPATSSSSASALLCCGCRTCSCCPWALGLSQELLPSVVTFAYQEVAFGAGGIYFHLSTVPAKFDLYLCLSACFGVQRPVHPFVEPSGLLFSCLSWLFLLTLELCQKHEYS